MWQADVQQRIKEYGQLYNAWEGSGRTQVVCLLDPPRNALPPQSYRQAQQNLYKIFEQIPGKESLVVGLQEDFWKEVRSTSYRVSDDYLDNGGLGVVFGLSKSSPRPDAIDLETAGLLAEYKRLENDSIDFMSRHAPFLQLIANAYREGSENKYSRELQSFLSLSASYRRDQSIELREYVLKLLERARLMNMDLSASRYKVVLLFESMSLLEPRVQDQKQKKVSDIVQPLADIVLLMSQQSTVAPRAVWQIHRYLLQAPKGSSTSREIDEAAEAEIERIDELLRQDCLPEPPEEIIEKACQLVKERCQTDVLLVRPGEDKQELFGQQGAMITNLMELAAVLGGAASFSWLNNYMHYLYFYERLKTMSGGMEARVLGDSITHLEREITDRLSTEPSDQRLAQMEPAIQFIEALGRYQILHGEEWRRVAMTLEIMELCAALSELGVDLPRQWQAEAQGVDRELGRVRDFFDLTVARGKDLASSICAAMSERKLERGVLYCDAFLYENLTRWFQSHNISYSLLFPRFSVS